MISRASAHGFQLQDMIDCCRAEVVSAGEICILEAIIFVEPNRITNTSVQEYSTSIQNTNDSRQWIAKPGWTKVRDEMVAVTAADLILIYLNLRFC
jgi:hypothetical protein